MSTERYIPESAVRELRDDLNANTHNAGNEALVRWLDEILATAAPQKDTPEPRRFREAAIALQESLSDLIQQSEGVAGLHLNGDVAPWEELMAGGRYEEWLRAYDDFGLAIAAAQHKDAELDEFMDDDDERAAFPHLRGESGQMNIGDQLLFDAGVHRLGRRMGIWIDEVPLDIAEEPGQDVQVYLTRPATAKPPTGGGWRCTECGIIYPDEMDPSEGEDCSCGASWDGGVERITFDARPEADEAPEPEGLREAALELASAEANYRETVQLLGPSDLDTGRAWDRMRKAGDRVRQALARPAAAEGVESREKNLGWVQINADGIPIDEETGEPIAPEDLWLWEALPQEPGRWNITVLFTPLASDAAEDTSS